MSLSFGCQLDANAAWSIKRSENAYVMNPNGRELADADVEKLKINALDVGNYGDEFKRILFRARKRNMPVLTLKNSDLSVGVIPELGGRIIRLTDRRSGFNYFCEPESDPAVSIGEKYFIYGGYEEYIGKGFAGPGWERGFTARQEGNFVKMISQEDDLRLERIVSLPEPGAAVLQIESILTNVSAAPVKTALRTHPLLQWGGNAGNVRLDISLADGSVRSSTVNMENDKMTANFGGKCILSGFGKTPLQYTVKANCSGKLYFCKTSDSTFTMEYLCSEVLLPPGKSIRIIQQFALQNQ